MDKLVQASLSKGESYCLTNKDGACLRRKLQEGDAPASGQRYLEEVRKLLASQASPSGADVKRLLGHVPGSWAESHYLAAVYQLRTLSDHDIPEALRHNAEKALELDPGNRSYLQLADYLRRWYEGEHEEQAGALARLMKSHERLGRRL